MNLDKIKDFVSSLGTHDLPTGAAAVVGLVLLFLVFKTAKFMMKLVLFLIAASLFAGAYWWHTHHG